MSTKKDNIERLILYFLVVLAIIAISLWTVFFIQISDLLDKSTKIIETSNQTQQKLNQTEVLLQQTKHEDEGREKQLNITRQIILEHHDDVMDYIIKTNNTTDKIIKENNLMLKKILDYIGID